MTAYDKEGLPEDLLTSKTIGERELKVSLTDANQTTRIMISAITKMAEQNLELLNEIKLLNARLESAFETGIKSGDL